MFYEHQSIRRLVPIDSKSILPTFDPSSEVQKPTVSFKEGHF